MWVDLLKQLGRCQVVGALLMGSPGPSAEAESNGRGGKPPIELRQVKKGEKQSVGWVSRLKCIRPFLFYVFFAFFLDLRCGSSLTTGISQPCEGPAEVAAAGRSTARSSRG